MNIEWKESPLWEGEKEGYATGEMVATVNRYMMTGTYRFTIWLEAVTVDGTKAEVGADFEHYDLAKGQAAAEEMLDRLMKAREK